jgi:hypothetical protein
MQESYMDETQTSQPPQAPSPPPLPGAQQQHLVFLEDVHHGYVIEKPFYRIRTGETKQTSSILTNASKPKVLVARKLEDGDDGLAQG